MSHRKFGNIREGHVDFGCMQVNCPLCSFSVFNSLLEVDHRVTVASPSFLEQRESKGQKEKGKSRPSIMPSSDNFLCVDTNPLMQEDG
mmetsp:Transcript_21140/g.42051  ORF Transcript_21140/g.42051 Transcript_21140/m.42051 type:complete len:88 (-) Transcript_21140:172-435(-)